MQFVILSLLVLVLLAILSLWPAVVAPVNKLRTGYLYRPFWSDVSREIAVPTSPELQKLTTSLVLLVILSEDPNFFSHRGFQFDEIFRRWQLFSRRLDKLRGGSSISQQLVKNLFLDNRRSIIRKFREVLLVFRVESCFSKEEILRLYLSSIRLTQVNSGVEAAARHYFGISAADLSLEQIVIIVGAMSCPATFDRHCAQSSSVSEESELPLPSQRMLQNVNKLLLFAIEEWGAPNAFRRLGEPFCDSLREPLSTNARRSKAAYGCAADTRAQSAIIVARAWVEVEAIKGRLGKVGEKLAIQC